MKKLNPFVMMMAAALAACEKQEPAADENEGLFQVTFHAPQWNDSQDIHLTPDVADSTGTDRASTRAGLSADGKAITDLWLLDYLDGQLVAQVHQTSDQDDFAEPTLQMTQGEHTLYFIASRGSSPVVSTDQHTIVWEKPSDTFYKRLTLTVSPQTDMDQTVTLQRIAARLTVKATDRVPDNAASVTITPDTWYFGLDYLTATAIEPRREARTSAIPAAVIGQEDVVSLSIFSICGDTDWQTDVSIVVTATDGTVIREVTLPDVSLRRNQSTVYSGALFSGGVLARALSISLDGAWGEDIIGVW